MQINVSATRDSWAAIQTSIQTQIHAMIESSDSVASRVAVFPLAPVSACIYAGYLLTNRLNIRGFQYHRDQATWAWPKDPPALTMPTVEEPVKSVDPCAELFFLFELTAPIDAVELLERTAGDRAVYRCSVPDPSTGWLKNKSNSMNWHERPGRCSKPPRFATPVPTTGTFSTQALLRAEWSSGNN